MNELAPEQEQITFGSRALTKLQECITFGYIFTEEEHWEHGREVGMLDDMIQWSIDQMHHGAVFGRWYSVYHPNGLLMPIPKIACWPISDEFFVEAQHAQWSIFMLGEGWRKALNDVGGKLTISADDAVFQAAAEMVSDE